MMKFEDHTKKYILSRTYDCNTRIIPMQLFGFSRGKTYQFYGNKKKHYCIKSIPLHIDKTMIEQEFYQVFNNRKSVEELEIELELVLKNYQICYIFHMDMLIKSIM